MHLTDQHKALLITFFIAGTVVLSVFSFGLKQKEASIAESYYEVVPEEPLTPEEIKVLEALDKLNNAKAETNQAYNQNKENKRFDQAYKSIAPPEDYVPKNSSFEELKSFAKAHDYEDSKLNREEISSFDKVNELLKKQKEDSNNGRSTISFSLIDREKIYIPIPVYLCEVGGRIVVNITVDSKGDVTDAYINNSSSTSNECLTNHALEYAKESKFSSAVNKASQLGTITFNFIGKH
ncbi:TonB family protein [Gaetbulibacter sp. M240]|uniref:TonB family protein n=1 Tax=Gaetbulibacter sp. M240 TaxID=3126511 RepID=UPI00374FB56E